MQIPFTVKYPPLNSYPLSSVDLSVPYCGNLSALTYRDHSINHISTVFRAFLELANRQERARSVQGSQFVIISALRDRVSSYRKLANFDKSWISLMLRVGSDNFLLTLRSIIASNIFHRHDYLNDYLENICRDAKEIIQLRQKYIEAHGT